MAAQAPPLNCVADQPKKLKNFYVNGEMINPATVKIGKCSTQLREDAKVAVVGRQASANKNVAKTPPY